ncbi:hypothetical protein R1sor_024846 [Riccia sorocarpa]|uniref:Uncharacterized protein n=1 Tax=Riccia sorocarpa TaxID=122646 RepID=A0ABD3GUS9_9MARC
MFILYTLLTFLQASEFRMRTEATSKRRLAPPLPEFLVGRDNFENNVAESISFKNRYGVTVPVAANSQEEEPSRSILKSPRGASDSGYDVHLYSRVTPTSLPLGAVRHSCSQTARQKEPDGRLCPITKANQLQTRPENGTSPWGDEGERNVLCTRELRIKLKDLIQQV